jgi:acetyl-CoA carboxylase beta subunit
MDIWNTMHAIVTSSDVVTLVIMVVIALGAGFMMQSMGSIVTTTFVALLAFALAGYIRAVTAGGQNAAAYAQSDWHGFLSLQMLTLVAYAITFAIVIAVVHVIRSLVLR